jgi:hypothetical protein
MAIPLTLRVGRHLGMSTFEDRFLSIKPILVREVSFYVGSGPCTFETVHSETPQNSQV